MSMEKQTESPRASDPAVGSALLGHVGNPLTQYGEWLVMNNMEPTEAAYRAFQRADKMDE